jgi:hypothetical protein
MKILLLQIEDRNDDKLKKFMENNEKICNENNIKYISLKKSRDHVPPYWGKIFEINKIMEEDKTIDYVIWLDSDAFFINYNNKRFHDFLKKYEKYSMIYTKDMPPWELGDFNAGSFIVKNNEIGRNIIKEWMLYYKSHNWTYKNSKWETKMVWAGEDYEQGHL